MECPDSFWSFFVSSICLLLKSKKTALFQLLLCVASVSQLTRSIYFLLQGVFELILESTTWGSTWSLARYELREENVFGIRARFPTHWCRRWWVKMFSRLSIFAWRRTSFFVIRSCHMFHRIWQSLIWLNLLSLRVSLLCEMNPMLDRKRRLQPTHSSLEEFREWRVLTFLWSLFYLSSGLFEGYCFLVDCPSPIGSFTSSLSQLTE